MEEKILFKRFKEKKIKLLFETLETTNGDILMSCRKIGIDYYLLANWMKDDKELYNKIKEISIDSSDEISQLISGRLNKIIIRTKEITQIILDAISQGIGIVAACEKIAGVSYQIFNQWCREDPKLREAINIVKETLYRRVENAYIQKLLEGKGLPLDYIFFLTNKLPDEYKNRQEISHSMSDNLLEKFKNTPLSELRKKAEELIGTARFDHN